MNSFRWLLELFVGGSIFWGCSFVAAGQKPGDLDPETREELRRDIERRHPDLDPKTKADMLQRIESMPKLHCAIEKATVYTDGIVCRGALSCDLAYDSRVSIMGRSFSPLFVAWLTDADKNQWEVPPLKSHYLFKNLDENGTMLIPRGKRVSFVHVDQLESPRPVCLQSPDAGKAKKPAEFEYRIASFHRAWTADMRKPENIYFIGRGKTSVEWKDIPVPPHAKTEVRKSQ